MNLADRHARALGLLLAAVLAALTAVLNVSRGPLSNLNDIGGWKNRHGVHRAGGGGACGGAGDARRF